MKDWAERLHWPSVVLMLGTLALFGSSVVAFFVLVPERMVDKLVHLPWSTILAVGAPALAAAVGVVRQAFTGPAVKAPAGSEPAALASEPLPAVLRSPCPACGQPLPEPEGEA